jgi:phosphoribosylformylglycinamidine (FGAM) synthase-like amidotransferase family enzyme
MYSLFLSIFAPHVSGAICTHLQEHKLQSTALGVCNGCGVLVHWSRYWLGHRHSFSAVSITQSETAHTIPQHLINSKVFIKFLYDFCL